MLRNAYLGRVDCQAANVIGVGFKCVHLLKRVVVEDADAHVILTAIVRREQGRTSSAVGSQQQPLPAHAGYDNPRVAKGRRLCLQSR